jgi:hypothetical protein
MAGMKVKCAHCGQRILVPSPPPQSKAGTNKTTLGKVIAEDETPTVPVATPGAPKSQPPPIPISSLPEVRPAPNIDEEERPGRRNRRKKTSRYEEDDYDDEFDCHSAIEMSSFCGH